MSGINNAQKSFRKTVVGMMGKSTWQQECCVCLLEFAPGIKVEQLACHPTHMIHENCY